MPTIKLVQNSLIFQKRYETLKVPAGCNGDVPMFYSIHFFPAKCWQILVKISRIAEFLCELPACNLF